MGRSEIVESYERFVSGGDYVRFIDCCLQYDFLGFAEDLEQMERAYWACGLKGPSISMTSNGSSGFSTRYRFGPYAGLIPHVENAMRGVRSVSHLVRVKSSYPWYDSTRFASMRSGDGSTTVKIDFTSRRCEEFFVSLVRPRSTIEVVPQVCRAMENREQIVRHVVENGVKVVSTCDDLVFRGLFPAFDRMIDWKTGCNFYTCSLGSKHFLPTWFERDGMSFNLLNPVDRGGHEVSDIFRPLSFRSCGCGRTAVEFEFVSHFRHKPKDAQGRLLNSALGSDAYRMMPEAFNAQVVEQGGEIHLLLDRDGSDLSFVPLLESFFGKAVRIHEGMISMIGLYKIPFAWKSDDLKTMPAHYPIL